jgi:hypothetical protein
MHRVGEIVVIPDVVANVDALAATRTYAAISGAEWRATEQIGPTMAEDLGSIPQILSRGIQKGLVGLGHGHQHSARAAMPVQETQRDRAQSSPARRSGSNYGWGAGAKPDGMVAVTLGVATLVSGTGGGVVVVTVCSVACGGATAPPSARRTNV